MAFLKRGQWSHGSQRLRLILLAVAIGVLASSIEITDTVTGSRWLWASVFGFAAVFAGIFAAHPTRRTWAVSGAATVSASLARAAAAFLSWDDRGRTTAQATTAGLTWVIVALLAFSAWETYTSFWEVLKDLGAITEEKTPTPTASVAATAATAIAAGATTDAAVIAEQAAVDAAKRAREDQ